MPIRFEQNMYQGINAHLNSILQQRGGGWQGFHNSHIAHPQEYLDEHLPEGDVVTLELGLQMAEVPRAPENESPGMASRRAYSDLAVEGARRGAPAAAEAVSAADAPSITTPLWASLDEPVDEVLTAVVIRQLEESGIGDPVTWIELLSPANKPGGSRCADYANKRQLLVRGGIVLVEIDYLHERPSPVMSAPGYTTGEEGAFPYTIAVSIPRPTFEDALTHLYGPADQERISAVMQHATDQQTPQPDEDLADE